MTLIPGDELTFTINGSDITLIGDTLNWQDARTVNTKKHFGSKFSEKVRGKDDVTFTYAGNVSAELYSALHAARHADAPVPFTLQIGTASAATDAGTHQGNCMVQTLSLNPTGDGDWKFSMSIEAHGEVTYTPPAS